MNVFNVHVNVSVAASSIVSYNRGSFQRSGGKSSLENEAVGRDETSATAFREADRRAHRPSYRDVSKLRTVKQGDRMGIIRFGSRVDVFLPSPAGPGEGR